MELSQIIFPACEGEPGLPAALWDKTYDDKSSSAPIRICSAPPLPSCPLPSVSHMSSYLPPAHLSFSFFAVLRLQKPRLFPLREGRLLGNGKQNCGPANTGARPGGAALTHITLFHSGRRCSTGTENSRVPHTYRWANKYRSESHMAHRFLEKHEHVNVQVHTGSENLSARIITALSLRCNNGQDRKKWQKKGEKKEAKREREAATNLNLDLLLYLRPESQLALQPS